MTREEAIEVYNGLINTKIKEAFEFFAPELRESEDERIVEDLIGGLMWQRDNLGRLGPHDDNLILPGFCENVGKHLSWLEKQKDTSKAIEAVDRIDKYIDEHLANAHDMKDSNPDKKYYRGWDDALGKMAGILQDVYSGEKQKEQPQEELVYRMNGLMQEYIKEGKDEAEKEHRFKCYQLFWDALEDADFFEQKEQPAEWSEEDEKMLERFLGWLQGTMGEKTYSSWLKSLPERFSPQPKQEWSEEDEENFKWFDKFFLAESVVLGGKDIPQDKYLWFKSLRPQPPVEWTEEDRRMLRACIEAVGSMSIRGDVQVLRDWLKSLCPECCNRPKPAGSWCPSEEQMDRLFSIVAALRKDYCDDMADFLASLYKQLKKL